VPPFARYDDNSDFFFTIDDHKYCVNLIVYPMYGWWQL